MEQTTGGWKRKRKEKGEKELLHLGYVEARMKKKVSPVEYPKKQQENLRGARFLFFFFLAFIQNPYRSTHCGV